MKDDWQSRQARALLARGLAAAGAERIPVYRPSGEDGAGPARRVGCLTGAAYALGQSARAAVDIPGVAARPGAWRALCAAGTGCAQDVRPGDLLHIGGQWYEAAAVSQEMGAGVEITLAPAWMDDNP